jgi:Double zinc ribbon
MATPITCRSCRHDNDPWRKHCGGCGSGLPGACATCGSVNGPTEKFCGGCAKRLRAVTLTKVFADNTIPIDVITDVVP